MSYSEKFDQIVSQTTFGLLPESEQLFVREKAHDFRFTQQELRIVSEMALDRKQWKESPLSSQWKRIQEEYEHIADTAQKKKRLISSLTDVHYKLKSGIKSYGSLSSSDKPVTLKPVLKTTVKPGLGLGRCPVASEKTRCCNLLTLDAVEKCGFDCSYCSIQSFYHGNEVVFDNDFSKKLAQLKLDPNKTYHVGTGQSSDSLMWGNHNGVLEALTDFAERHPNVILELKTKSRNIGWLMENSIPENMIVTWSLNPQTIIDHEEHLSASLEQRITSARRMADKGCIVGFHFHPIVFYEGWQEEYTQIGERLSQEFDPQEVALVSMGTLTYTRSVMKTIRRRDLTSKILQMPMEEIAGKYSYPLEVKLDMFRGVYNSLSKWHGEVFFYLCMEAQSLWMPVFGYEYEDNLTFEAAMKASYFGKIYPNEHPAVPKTR